jgi:hypothetical protein
MPIAIGIDALKNNNNINKRGVQKQAFKLYSGCVVPVYRSLKSYTNSKCFRKHYCPAKEWFFGLQFLK